MKKKAIDKKVKNVETQTKDISSATNFTQTEAEVGSNTETNADKMNVETQTISNESKTHEHLHAIFKILVLQGNANKVKVHPISQRY